MPDTALMTAEQHYDLIHGGVLDPGDRHTFLDTFQTMTVEELDQQIVRGFAVREASTHIFCTALAEMQNRWQTGGVSLDMMGGYELDFHTYVRMRTKTDYSNSAIDNFAAVGRVWFTDEIPEGIPATVQLYNADGQRVVDGEGELVTVPFNPCLLNTSKLVHAKAALSNGSLARNPVALGQLFNSDVGFRIAMASLGGGTSSTQSSYTPVELTGLRLFIEGPLLMAEEEGHDPAVVAEIDWESVKIHEVARRALQLIVAACMVENL